MKRAMTVVALCMAVVVAGCGGGEKVGSNDLLDFDEQEGSRIGGIDQSQDEGGAAATTTAPPTTVAPATTSPPTTRRTATTSPPTTQAQTAFTVKIISGGQGFDPFNFAVRKGTRLRVENTDNQARTFTSDEPGVFDSGPIPPGGTFTYVADRLGKFNFRDDTRPFAVGQMEVTG